MFFFLITLLLLCSISSGSNFSMTYDSCGNVSSVSGASGGPLADWAEGRVGSGGTPLDLSTAALDDDLGSGFSVLEAYAFGLDPSSRQLDYLSDTVTDTSGLPRITTLEAGPITILQLEHLRRRGVPELEYEVQFGNDLTPSSWEQPESAPNLTVVNSTWERIRLFDHENSTTQSKRFGRVKVTYTGPPPEPVPVEGMTPTPDGAYVDSLTPTIAWEGTGFVAQYDFELSEGSPGTPLPNYSAILAMPWAQIAPDHPLNEGTVYHWRQREVGGTWSGWQSFTTSPGTTTPTSPRDVQVDSRIPVYNWQATPGASVYEWKLASGTPASNQPLSTRTTTGTSFPNAHSALPFSAEFVWQVRAGNPQGAYGPVSEWLSFSTPVQLLTPANQQQAIPFDTAFTWTEFAGRPNRLQLSWNSGFTALFFNDIVSGARKVFPTGDTGLTPEATMYWRVGADFPNGTRWSTPRSFRVTDIAPGSAPQITSPLSSPVSRTPRLQWNWVPDGAADSYEVVIERFDGPSQSWVLHWGETVVAQGGAAAYALRIPVENKLIFDSSFRWRVRGVSGDGHPGPFSFNSQMLVPNDSQPNLRSPSHNATGQSTTLTLKWNEVAGGGTKFQNYRVQIFTDPSLDSSTRIHNNASTPHTSLNYTVPAGVLQSGTTYYWRVKALGTGIYSDDLVFSSYRGFTTQ